MKYTYCRIGHVGLWNRTYNPSEPCRRRRGSHPRWQLHGKYRFFSSKCLWRLFTTLSLITLTFIAVERYCAVVFHLRYNEKVTVKRTIIALLSTWITVPLASTLIAIEKLDARDFLLAHAIIILAGIFITCLCYFKVFLVLRQHYGQISIQLQALSWQQSARNTVHFRRKFSTVLYIVGAFVACYLPYSVAVLARFGQRSRIMVLAVLLGGNSCINPLIYFWRIRELREAAKRHITKVVKCWRSSE